MQAREDLQSSTEESVDEIADELPENPSPEEFARRMAGEQAQYIAEDESDIIDTNPQSNAELEALKDELKDKEEQLLRLAAEMQNLRKRTQKDVEDARKFAISSFAKDLMAVMDNLERALDSLPEGETDDATSSFIEGVRLTADELGKSFARHGLQEISPQMGDEFDHNLHQAMLEVPSADIEPGRIAQIIQKGYIISDRLLRPSMVGVAK